MRPFLRFRPRRDILPGRAATMRECVREYDDALKAQKDRAMSLMADAIRLGVPQWTATAHWNAYAKAADLYRRRHADACRLWAEGTTEYLPLPLPNADPPCSDLMAALLREVTG